MQDNHQFDRTETQLSGHRGEDLFLYIKTKADGSSKPRFYALLLDSFGQVVEHSKETSYSTLEDLISSVTEQFTQEASDN